MAPSPREFTRWFAGDPAPPLDDVNLLVAMGGPMGVNDEVFDGTKGTSGTNGTKGTRNELTVVI